MQRVSVSPHLYSVSPHPSCRSSSSSSCSQASITWQHTEEEEAGFFDEGVGDVYAPVHDDSLLNMEFESEDEEEDYDPSKNCDDY